MKKKPEGPAFESLAELAKELGLEDDFLDGDLEYACQEDMDEALENIKAESVEEQLDFLHSHGTNLKRLEEMIRDYAKEKEK